MATIIKNMIEISGIDDAVPITATCFKQACIADYHILPESKPDILQVIRTIGEISILNTKVVKGFAAKSLEDFILTGVNLLVEGVFREKIEYIAASSSHAISAVYFSTPFSSMIALPENFAHNSSVNVESYILDMFIEHVDNRTLYRNAVVFLNIDL